MPSTKQLLKQVSAAADRVVRPPDGITVLIYHRVGGGSDSDVDLDVAAFDRQLEHLAAHHEVISLTDAVDRLETEAMRSWADDEPGTEATSAVVLTFDDGTIDFTEHAAPLLERHGLPATLFVATRFVDAGEEFPWGAPPTTWSALRDAAVSGLVTVDSHTHGHWLLDRLDVTALDDDLDRSIELIGANCGRPPEHFAYPKAIPGSPDAEVSVRRRFRSASLAASRVNRPGRTDLHRIWRTPIQRSDGFEHFARKAAGGHRLEGELRLAAARVKYRGTTR